MCWLQVVIVFIELEQMLFMLVTPVRLYSNTQSAITLYKIAKAYQCNAVLSKMCAV